MGANSENSVSNHISLCAVLAMHTFFEHINRMARKNQ